MVEVIGVYEEALAPAPRQERPDDWARAQSNFGLAFLEIGRRASDIEPLRRALEAIDGALEAYRAAGPAFYIEKAERLRDNIVATHGGEDG